MKKVAAILLAMMMLVSLVACGAKTAAPAADTKSESQPAAQSATEPKKEEAPANAAAAPSFPTKPITLNLTGKPGSGTDILFRALGSALEAETGCTMVCVTQLWAPNLLSTMEAAPDGYTLCALPSANVCRSLVDAGSQDPNWKDVLVLAAVSVSEVAIGVSAADERFANMNTLADLIEWLKANPSEHILLGCGSKSSVSTIAPTVLFRTLNLLDQITFVNSSDDNELTTSILNGSVDVFANTTGGVYNLYQEEKVKILGVFSEERSSFFPDAQTIKEQGYDVVVPVFHLIATTKDTPVEVQNVLIEMLKKASTSQGFADATKAQGYTASFQDQATTIAMLENLTAILESVKTEIGWK